MSNFSFAKNHSSAFQSNLNQQEGLQNLFHKLKQLNQVQDESRNEQCPAFLDEQSLKKSRPSSPWQQVQYPTHINILQQLEQTTPQPVTLPRPPLNSNLKRHQGSAKEADLRIVNKKLQQDNIKLFAECMRLRKLCKHQEIKIEEINSDKKKAITHVLEQSKQLQQENKSLWGEVEQLRMETRRLQQKLKQATLELTSYEILSKKYEKVSNELRQTETLNQQLHLKVVKLQHELEIVNSRNSSKSSQSYGNSTQQSRKTQADMDRKINNMKIVHQSELRKLKQVIEELKKQVNRYEGKE